MKIVAAIPARYESSRYPGKPLADLAGRPMLWHVYQRARRVKEVDEVYVATDDRRIADCCDGLDIPYRMTGPQPSGTDRVAEFAREVAADAYINVQGDEPLLDPTAVQLVAEALRAGAKAVATCTDIDSQRDIVSHDIVKIVHRSDGGLLYLSRQPIPYPKTETPFRYLRQVGLYGFCPAELQLFTTLSAGYAEKAEGIELLRLLENNVEVLVVNVPNNGLAVDSQADLLRAREAIAHDRLSQVLLAETRLQVGTQ